MVDEINVKDNSTITADVAKMAIQKHCPELYRVIDLNNDPLLVETAQSTLSWIVFRIPDTNLEYAIKMFVENNEIPIKLLDLAEERFLELKTVVKKARGDSDITQVVQNKIKEQAPSLFEALNKDGMHSSIKKAAENCLSKSLLSKKGADYNFCKLYIANNLETNLRELENKLQSAELDFIDVRGFINSVLGESAAKEANGVSKIIQSIQIGISRYNIFFVLILITGLGWSAINLPQQALALVAASIGAAISHLLAERNTVLGAGDKDKGGECNCKK